MSDKVMFTVPELAKRWGFSRDTIYRMVRAGELKACPFKHIRVLKEEVERWEETGDRTMWAHTSSARSSTQQLAVTRRLSVIATKTASQGDDDLASSVRERVERRLTNGLVLEALSKKSLIARR